MHLKNVHVYMLNMQQQCGGIFLILHFEICFKMKCFHTVDNVVVMLQTGKLHDRFPGKKFFHYLLTLFISNLLDFLFSVKHKNESILKKKNL